MTVRKYRVKSRLSRELLNPKGKMARDVLADAEAAVATLNAACEARIDEIIAEIDQRFGRGAPREQADVEQLYQLSSGIIDISGCILGQGVDRAAFMFCDLADRIGATGVWDWPAVDVFIDSLKLLRHQHGVIPEAKRDEILAGLAAVVGRDRVSPAAEDE